MNNNKNLNKMHLQIILKSKIIHQQNKKSSNKIKHISLQNWEIQADTIKKKTKL